jgi:hypothetical protein
MMDSIVRFGEFFLKIHDLFDLHQKPPVNFREVENLLDGEAGAQGVADEEDAFVPQWRDRAAGCCGRHRLSRRCTAILDRF